MQTKKLNYNKTSVKTKLTLGLCCVMVVSSLDAQKTKLDSIAIDPIEKSLRIAHPEINFVKPLEFTETNVFFEHNTLKFSRVQTPEETNQIGFGSTGVFQLNPKLILSGELKVISENEKQVSFILTDERTTNQNYISNPSYFYAPRKSNWLKQHYYVNGNIAYKPWKGIIIGAEVNGSFLKGYGNRDPRPEIGNIDYNIDARIGYQFGKHTLLAKAGYFNRKKESNIGYAYSEHNAPNYYETYIRFNRGYGNFYYNSGYSDNWYQYDGIGLGAEYMFQSDKHSLVAGFRNEEYIDRMTRFYTYQIRDENNVQRTIRDRLKISGLKTQKHQSYIKYLGKLGDWKWNSDFNLLYQEDLNYDYQNLYTSYKAWNQQINWRNAWSKYNDNNELLRLSFNVDYSRQSIKDLSVMMHKKLQAIQYQLGALKEFKLNNSQKLALELQQGLYLPLDSKMHYVPYQSSIENIFVKNIAMPDYFYDSSIRLNLGAQLKYMIDRNNVRYEVYATGKQWFFVENVNGTKKGDLDTGASQYVALGLNFYY